MMPLPCTNLFILFVKLLTGLASNGSIGETAERERWLIIIHLYFVSPLSGIQGRMLDEQVGCMSADVTLLVRFEREIKSQHLHLASNSMQSEIAQHVN